ncbi:hypothetical protein FACS1894170_03110 [Planctomycetales bacterium]|nr:hypothetical protein FACS1894170_03110 [Planctomycetales bacterium]
MQLEQYTQFALGEKTFEGTRILVVPNADVAQRLTKFYTVRENSCERIQLADCISADETFLSMPDVVFEKLTNKIQGDNLSIVAGLHAYLLLLNNEKREQAFAKLKHITDDPNGRAIFIVSIVWKKDLEKMFRNPGYQSGRQIVYIDDYEENKNLEVILVDRRWIDIQPPNCNSFKTYLATTGDFPTYENGKIIVALPDNDRKIAGLNDSVKQVHTLADFMRQFRNVDNLSNDKTLQWILDKANELRSNNGLLVVRQHFFPDGLSGVLQFAPKRIVDERDDTAKDAMLWMLRHSIRENSYLYAVLSEPELNGENFLTFYTVHTAVKLLKDKNAAPFAEERKIALKEFGDVKNALVSQFITQTKGISLQQFVVWLNNDTAEEHAELVRRFAEYDTNDIYPALRAYLTDYNYGSKELTSYFKQYRKFKLHNKLTDNFYQESFDTKFSDIPLRDSELRQYSQDSKTALLVVDAMGAEYLPLLIEQAPLYGLKIEKHYAVSSQLPTSTKFNRVDWRGEKLPEIKALDNIVHDGAERHQPKEYHENIAEVLDKVLPQIFNAVAQNIHNFDRIILTADHGASRLAVLANELDLAKTLNNPSDEKPDDWRYIKVPQGKRCPDEFIETIDGNYWVVRGYNRLPKQGGKQYELHGGYTPEECLVPLIVFSKFAVAEQVKEQPKQVKQLVEKDDFDI